MIATGTKEWAVHNENMLKGCLHDCRYCYAHAMAKRFDRVGENGWISELVVENQLAKTTSMPVSPRKYCWKLPTSNR